jgi:hypothetical protein
VRLQMVARTGHPDFLDLPWDVPLAAWTHDRIVDVPTGIHRHVVRVVEYDDRRYVLKELPRRYALREYRFLRHLDEEGVPVVQVVGVVRDRNDAAGEPLEAVLITEHLAYSLPYRLLFLRKEARELREPMLDALVDLLVRVHLVGFLWGDCSLSNTLFRRDAGQLAAYVVDTETGELHVEGLTPGQREYDIETAIERCAGELFDLLAQGMLPPETDPVELAEELRARYARLWDELTREEVFSTDERYRIHDRLRRINELGYDVEELEIVGDENDDHRMRLRTRVVEPRRHRPRLRELTGLDVQENQARRLLNDIANFGAWLQSHEGRTLSEQVIAHRWLQQSFEPTVEVVPPELWTRREPAELFHEILDHWYFLSTCEGKDMELIDAARSYVDNVLAYVPEERTIDADAAGVLAEDELLGP